MEVDIGYRTDVGRRREHNEDDVAIFGAGDAEPDPLHDMVLVVADGMGGHAAGEVASRAAVETIRAAYYGDSDGSIEERLARALQAADAAVLRAAEQDARYTGMGTTLAAAVLRDREMIVTNVGDCRVYLWRRGNLERLTRDQSFVAELLASGRITAAEAQHHPMRNVVTNAIGIERALHVEISPRRTLEDGDVVVLCSDGLWSMVPDHDISSVVATNGSQRAADLLVRLANEAGGHDNITVVICRVVELLTAGDGDTTVLLGLAADDDRTVGLDVRRSASAGGFRGAPGQWATGDRRRSG